MVFHRRPAPVLVIPILLLRASAAPAGVHNHYVGYVQDPNGRGTSSLVISCLLTLLLCVWSALHLNVPHQYQTRAETVLANVRWIIVGIYAPELVVFTAWRQWSSARILGRIVKEHQNTIPSFRTHSSLSEPTKRTSMRVRRKYPWTMTHDFFASTGGLAFEKDSWAGEESDKGSRDEFLPRATPKRLALTAKGVALLAECGFLPDIPEEDILDKSKANGLAKALVVIQALWMLLQVIGRIISRLPVTLLEVNTVAHVLVSLFKHCRIAY